MNKTKTVLRVMITLFACAINLWAITNNSFKDIPLIVFGCLNGICAIILLIQANCIINNMKDE